MGQDNFTENSRLDTVKQITDRGHSVADVLGACSLAVGCQHALALLLDEAVCRCSDKSCEGGPIFRD